MPRRFSVGRTVAAAFNLINLGGLIYALVTSEPMHAAVHGVLLVLGVVFYGALQRRSAPQSATALPQETSERLQHLEQSVDKLAIGVERVGEAQRYQTKILDERTKARTPKNEG